MGRSQWQQWWKQANLSEQRIVYEVTVHPVNTTTGEGGNEQSAVNDKSRGICVQKGMDGYGQAIFPIKR